MGSKLQEIQPEPLTTGPVPRCYPRAQTRDDPSLTKQNTSPNRRCVICPRTPLRSPPGSEQLGLTVTPGRGGSLQTEDVSTSYSPPRVLQTGVREHVGGGPSTGGTGSHATVGFGQQLVQRNMFPSGSPAGIADHESLPTQLGGLIGRTKQWQGNALT